MSKDANFGLRLVVQRCSGQKWMIRNWIKHPRHWSERTTSDTVRTVFQVAVGSENVDSSEMRLMELVCGVSCYGDLAAHWAALRPQSFPTLNLEEQSDQLMCCTELRVVRDLMASWIVWNGSHFWHSDPCTELSNKTVQCTVHSLKVVRHRSKSFFLYDKTMWKKNIWACEKLWFSIATSKWMFWALI